MRKDLADKLKGPYVQIMENYLLPDVCGSEGYNELLNDPYSLINNAIELNNSFQRMEDLYDNLEDRLEDAALLHKRGDIRKIELGKDATSEDIKKAKEEAVNFCDEKNKYAMITMPVYNKGDIERTLFEFSLAMIDEMKSPEQKGKKKKSFTKSDVEKRCRELMGDFDNPSNYIKSRQQLPIRKGYVKLLYGISKPWEPESKSNSFIINSRMKGEGDVLMKSLRRYAEQKVYESVVENIYEDPSKRDKIINPGCPIKQLCRDDINGWTYTMPSFENSKLMRRLVIEPLKGYLGSEEVKGWSLQKGLKMEQEKKKNVKNIEIKPRSRNPRASLGNAELQWQDVNTLYENNWVGAREGGKMPRTFFETQRLLYLPPGFMKDGNVQTYLSGFNESAKNRIQNDLHKKYRRELECSMDKVLTILEATQDAFEENRLNTSPEIIINMKNTIYGNQELMADYKKRHKI